MSSKPIIVDDLAPALAGYPHARRAGDYLYLSGMSSRRADNTWRGVSERDGARHLDIGEQTLGVIANIEGVLRGAGGELANLVEVTVFLVDMGDYDAYNAAWNQHFDAGSGPARTTVAVRELPHPNLLIEMRAVAYFGSS